MQVAEHTIELAGAPVFYRSAGSSQATSAGERRATPLFLHGVPTSSDDWLDLLARSGGLAPDLVGFGRSAKAANLDYTLTGAANFVAQFLDELGAERVSIVGNGWGAAAGLLFAQNQPSRVQALVLVNALPLLEGFSWPAPVRTLRRPAIGELAMGAITRRRLTKELRSGYADPARCSETRLQAVWSHFDQGTQRAVLRLLRATDSDALARFGERLDQLTMPALVIAGERDPWLEPSLAEELARGLNHAEVSRIPDAGHWPWLEHESVGTRIADFLEAL